MQATITVAGITPPAIGKKQGHIIDSAGSKWNVWGDKLQNYRIGGTYEITYDQNEFNGKTFNVIKSANPSNAAPSQPSRVEQKPADGWPGPIQQQPSAKDEMIFVCGVVNNAMSNTNINPFEITLTELIAMVDKARSAWRNTLGKSQRRDDMDDGIPY